MQKVKYNDATLICCLGHICLFSRTNSSITAYTKQSFSDIAAYSEGIHKNVHITLYYHNHILQRVCVLRADKVSLFDGIL
jgi:hypothetical protein